MKCGHSANAYKIKDGVQIDGCAICDCFEEEEELPDLTGRKAICTGHKWSEQRIVDSNFNLPFFKNIPDQEYDAYYCGCWGWD